MTPGRSGAPHLGADVRRIVHIGAPLIINNLSTIAVNVADTVMAGRLGAEQLAGLAIGNGIWVAVFLLGLGILMALGPTVAQHYGAGRERDIGEDTRQGLLLAALISVVVCTALRGAEPLVRAAGIAPAVALIAQRYLDALSWGVAGAYGYHALKQMSEGCGRTLPIMGVMMAVLPLNVALNYCFVFGRLGMPALGAAGCGVGSAVSFWLMFALLAAYMSGAPFYRRFALWHGEWLPDMSAQMRLLALGAPIGVSLFLQSGLFTGVALLIGRHGAAAVAAHQVTLNFCGLVFMAPVGFAMALAVCVGQALGAGDIAGARRQARVGFVLCGACALCAAAATLACAPGIVTLYTNEGAVVEVALALFGIAAWLQVADGLQVAAAFALRGLKDTRVPMGLNALTYWGLGFVLAVWLGQPAVLGPRGIWIALATALSVAALALHTRFHLLTGRLLRAADRR